MLERTQEVEIRYPEEREMPELFALLNACFPNHKKIFELMEEGALAYEPKILLLSGKIISNISLIRRDICIGSKILKGGGIGCVATHPDYRRRGYAKMLLKDRLSDIFHKELHFSPLFTDKPSVYEKLGWKTFPQKFWVLEGMKVPLNVRRKNVEVFHRSTTSLREELRRIYEETMFFFPGALKRDEKYWQEYFCIFDLVRHNESFFLLREGNVGRAYARICRERNDILLGEMGVRKEDNDAIKALFYYLLDWVRDSGFKKLVISLPPLHPIFKFLEVEGVRLKEESSGKREVLMINIISSQGEILRDKQIEPYFHWQYFDKI